MTHPNSFGKAEHLYGEKRIARLFTQGDAFIVYPLRTVYILGGSKEAEPVKVMVSVPKKRFKRAVKRNKLKRRMREAYRLNKQLLMDEVIENDLQLHLSFNYVSNDEVDFETLDKKMKLALQKLTEIIQKRQINQE
jgi:ribonuclease P protein component